MKKTFVMALLLAGVFATGCAKKQPAAKAPAAGSAEMKTDDKAAAPADATKTGGDAKAPGGGGAAGGGGGSMKDPCEGGQ